MSFFKGNTKERQRQATEFMDLLTEATFGQSDRAIDELPKAHAKIMAYMAEPRSIYRAQEKARIEAFTASSDIPRMITDNFDSFLDTDEYDMHWEAAYKDVTLEPGRLFWEIMNVTSGVTFQKVPEGAKVDVRALSGTKVMIHCEKYGGALGWSQELLMSRNWNAMEDMAMDFRESYWADKADRHYAILAAAKNSTATAWATTTVANTDPLYRVTRDIGTLENGGYTLTNRIKDKGYGDVANRPLLLLAPVALRSRILRALAYTGQDVAGAPNRVTYPITPRFTFNEYLTEAAGSSSDTKALLLVPGKRIQKATAMEPTNYMRKDIQSLTDIQVVWSFYGAGVGFESGFEQIQELEFS